MWTQYARLCQCTLRATHFTSARLPRNGDNTHSTQLALPCLFIRPSSQSVCGKPCRIGWANSAHFPVCVAAGSIHSDANKVEIAPSISVYEMTQTLPAMMARHKDIIDLLLPLPLLLLVIRFPLRLQHVGQRFAVAMGSLVRTHLLRQILS